MRGEVEVYVGEAEIDPYLQPGEMTRLRGALEGAAVSHVMELYEGVEHGFTVLRELGAGKDGLTLGNFDNVGTLAKDGNGYAFTAVKA